MKHNPLISIFIPAYNADASVRQAIESVLAQTYTNYELIIINDASTDQTGIVIEHYQGYPQVKIYHNPTNLGVTGNWQRGIELCQGDFIARLDADDFYAPDYLQQILSIFEQFPKTNLVFTGANLIYHDGKIRPDLPYPDSWVRPGREFLLDLLRICRVWSPSVCVRRGCYEQWGMVIADMKIHEDWELWVRFSANSTVGYLAAPLVNIRLLNPGGCTTQAIIHAHSPTACQLWLDKLDTNELPYHLNRQELSLLKQGMYNIVMTFAVFAMESGLSTSVQKHLDFAKEILPTKSSKSSMTARLYAKAAEIYFMEGGHHLKGWKFLLQAFRFGFPPLEKDRQLKLFARAFLGKTIFEWVREATVARHKFPYTKTG